MATYWPLAAHHDLVNKLDALTVDLFTRTALVGVGGGT